MMTLSIDRSGRVELTGQDMQTLSKSVCTCWILCWLDMLHGIYYRGGLIFRYWTVIYLVSLSTNENSMCNSCLIDRGWLLSCKP